MELLEVIKMLEANYKVPGGKLIKVKLSVSSDKIEMIHVLGDFFLHPEETILSIEESLLGTENNAEEIEKIIDHTLNENKATLIGATAADISKAIMIAWNSK